MRCQKTPDIWLHGFRTLIQFLSWLYIHRTSLVTCKVGSSYDCSHIPVVVGVTVVHTVQYGSMWCVGTSYNMTPYFLPRCYVLGTRKYTTSTIAGYCMQLDIVYQYAQHSLDHINKSEPCGTVAGWAGAAVPTIQPSAAWRG